MRNAMLGALLIAGLWIAAEAGRSQLSAAGPTVEAVGHELVTLATPAGDNRQMLTIVDPRARAICVYHVETASGAIALKSVRNIHWDLQMVDYNGVSPLPGDLRSMSAQR